MLIVNWSGLGKIYWIPKIEYASCDRKLWFFGIKFLCIQVCLYSCETANYLIDSIKRGLT